MSCPPPRIALLLSITLVVGSGPPAVAAEPVAPSLVVVLSIDQLRRDRLDPALPGGLGRIAREGQLHEEALLDHATSETCPGHASMVTGRHPGRTGIPGNSYVDPASGENWYCVEDRSADAAVIGGDPDPTEGRSPRALRVDTLGDWMKAKDARSRVFSVSGKDRSAITLAGHKADGAYWLLRSGAPGFTTSHYYRPRLPDWVEAWNAQGLASRVPERWEHLGESQVGPAPRADDFPGESDDYSRTSPHPLRDDDPEDTAENIYRSPFVDALTLAFAERMVEEEGLGQGGSLDLLGVSLSGVDTVGHEYGPWSRESRDALLRVDLWLADFLDGLEARLGKGRVLVVLSADHGVMALPEWLAQQGSLTCPLEGGRESLILFMLGLWWELHFELTPFSLPGLWVHPSNQLTVNRARAEEYGVDVERVVAVAERWLEARPSVREAWTREEIETGEGDIARLYRNSLDPARSGDIAIQFEPTCLPDFTGAGTTHGSAYIYDRAVPIAFWGAGIQPRRVAGPASTIDIAPSLATRLGVPLPDDLDGRSLLAPAD